MIKIDALREFRPTYKYDNGSGITLAERAIRSWKQSKTIMMPFSYTFDQVIS